ncbi:VTT domain-containing protein (plasmid) [Vibrio sp. SS-MA-C1-2]|uniref:TVP38/TMEM64 family protein n=1 Tax=Vibrio sp. SS-MA-C1-2 TaxID=2908646 RepID=UPI001F348EAC|nr:VTT domain-containing protein [Vibrio sp. SS-MA-C1-2]UJF20257.1 VTT domain-containing protein [Vibrio sp. SS-MA-C1-2]
MNKWLKSIMIFLIIIGLYFLSKNAFLQHLLNNQWLYHYVSSHGTTGHIILFLFAMLLVGVGGPKQIIAFSYGFIYGLREGVLLTMAIYMLVAVLTYSFSSFSLQSYFSHHSSKKIQKFKQFIGDKAFIKVLILRIFPIGSNLATNLFAGSLGIPFLSFISASFIGYIPQVIIFCLAGTGVSDTNHLQLSISLGLFFISLVLTAYLYKHHVKSMIVMDNQ